MKTTANQLFDEFNRKYWRGRLPRYRVIFRNKIGDDFLGMCNSHAKTILLKKSLVGDDLRLTLLHEMCHIGGSYGGNGHGPAFLRKLRRLVRLGETKLVEEDIERYDGTATEREIAKLRTAGESGVVTSFPDRVFDDLYSASQNPWASRRRWPTVRRWLAIEHKISEARLQRACPWAEGEWRRLSRDTREANRQARLSPEMENGSEAAVLRNP